MYIVGNTITSSYVPMWTKVISMLKNTGNLGLSLPLCCFQHPNTQIDVSTPDDFLQYAPEGGCALKFNLRLDCGHACTFKCHSRPRHESVICQEDCERVRDSCSHPCAKRCGEKCGDCTVKIKQLALPCGHIKSEAECYRTLQISSIKCEKVLEKQVPSCGHWVKVKCDVSVSDPKYRCHAPCGSVLLCGHQCQRPCHSCRDLKEDGSTALDHKTCIILCGRSYSTCAHFCTAPCHGDQPCPLCRKPCMVKCSHSSCARECQEPCAPCAEPCISGCPHQGQCQMPCAVPCDVLPCSRRCEKTLKCGHQCPSVCGEKCPLDLYCQVCSSNVIKEAVVDYIEGLTYQEIDLDQQPVIIPECGHLMIINSMDGLMDMSSQYQMSEDRLPESLRSESQPLSINKVKGCPLCRGSLHQIERYNRIVKRAFLDEATKKFIVWSNAHFVPLTIRLKQQEEELVNSDVILDSQKNRNTRPQSSVRIEGSQAVQLQKVSLLSGLGSRHGQITRLHSDIALFYIKVIEEEQPFSKVQQMVEVVTRKTGVNPTFIYNTEVLQTRSRLMVKSLLLRCELALLSDIVKIHDRNDPIMARVHPWLRAELSLDFQANRLSCLKLAEDAIGRQQPMIEIEARLLFGRYVGLERAAPIDSNRMQKLFSDAAEQIEKAKLVIDRSPSTLSMLSEIAEVESLLRGSTFYSIVTNEEKQAIYNAMAQEFQGTGHWYFCVNMHPVISPLIPLLLALMLTSKFQFTVADCGAPMITSQCPECGEPVGGSSYRPVDGVSHARDLEAQFGALRV